MVWYFLVIIITIIHTRTLLGIWCLLLCLLAGVAGVACGDGWVVGRCYLFVFDILYDINVYTYKNRCTVLCVI